MVSTQLHDSVFLRCLRKEETKYTPIWLMRQAGRYQNEYRDIRSKVGFLELCKTPELVTEVTLLAVQQLGVDAAIIFADILLPLDAIGLGLRFTEGDGPVFDKPIKTIADIESFPEIYPESDLSYVMEGIKGTVKELGDKTPLIGFAGAPYTLASYAIEGAGSRNYEKTKTLMYTEPETWNLLMTKLGKMTYQYLLAQIRAGASAVQIFDSWVGSLSPRDYARFVLPYMQELISSLKGHVPVIYFGTMTGGLLHLIAHTGADVIGVDWRIELDHAWDIIGHDKCVQGNLDPLVLFAGKDEIDRQTQIILEQTQGRPGHVFNLGHGILPSTPKQNVRYLVDLVHDLTKK